MTDETDRPEHSEEDAGTPPGATEAAAHSPPPAPAPATASSNPVSKATGAIVSAIELCGRHPFATGLFALLGLTGLVLSVISFQVDRRESRETTDLITEMKRELVSDDVYDHATYSIAGGFDDLSFGPDGAVVCKPNNEHSFDELGAFLDFLMAHQNETVFLEFTMVDEECTVIEGSGKSSVGDKRYDLLIQAGRFSNFTEQVRDYRPLDVDQSYIDKARDVLSPAFTLYTEKRHTGRNLTEEYLITFWPPVTELQTFTFNADEYGLNHVSGMYKIKVPTASGGYSVQLIPVEAIDVEKFERTRDAVKNTDPEK